MATTTPEQDEILDELRARLREWLLRAADDGIDYDIALTALMLFTASGIASSKKISKADFLDMMGRYYDIYAPKPE